MYLSICLCLSPLTICLSLVVCMCLSLSVSVFLFVPLCHFVTDCFTVYLHLYITLCLSFRLFSLSVRLYDCLSIYLSLKSTNTKTFFSIFMCKQNIKLFFTNRLTDRLTQYLLSPLGQGLKRMICLKILM